MKNIRSIVARYFILAIASLVLDRTCAVHSQELAPHLSVDRQRSTSLQKTSVTTWSPLGTGVANVVDAVCIDGSNVYVSGSFTTAGGNPALRIAMWNGSSWSALGTGLNNEATSVAVIGSSVYAAGFFTTAGGNSVGRIARWDGASWSALGVGVNGTVRALAVNGTDLLVGGDFSTAGGLASARLARWDGAGWNIIGAVGSVLAIAVSGSDVYVGGTLTSVGGTAVNNIAKWNGSSWVALAGGVTGSGQSVRAIAVSGSNVYVGGDFNTADGNTANKIAVWNGSAWSAMGTGMDGSVSAIAVSGSDVYAAGSFGTADGNAATRVAIWNGSAWSAVGAGTNGGVNAMAVNPSAGAMVLAGSFSTGDGVSMSFVGQFTDSNNPLPIELTLFSAVAVDDRVELNWKTKSEANNYGFELERRTTPVSLPLQGGDVRGGWNKAGFVEGSGTTNAPREYSFIDKSVSAGKYAYRLKQLDRNGQFRYSQEVEAIVGNTPKIFALSQNYPNPFNPTTIISYQLPVNSHVSVRVYDAIGREVAVLVNEVKEAGYYSVPFNASGLASGVYFMRMQFDGKQIMKKMNLIK